MKLFAVVEDATHHVGDPRCPSCAEEYPEPCRCGGLIHAVAEDVAEEGEITLVTRCDSCGRSEDDLEDEPPAGSSR